MEINIFFFISCNFKTFGDGAYDYHFFSGKGEV